MFHKISRKHRTRKRADTPRRQDADYAPGQGPMK